MTPLFVAARKPIANRGGAPDWFLNQLVPIIRDLDPAVFANRKDDQGETDIFTDIRPFLGPPYRDPNNQPIGWVDLLDRRAAMCVVLTALAAFESSFKMTTGADTTNPAENSDETYSAGPYQISYNSRHFGADLRLILGAYKIANGRDFQAKMKSDFTFATIYTASLLRHTIRHNGPIRDHHIDKWLSREAKEEFKEALQAS